MVADVLHAFSSSLSSLEEGVTGCDSHVTVSGEPLPPQLDGLHLS